MALFASSCEPISTKAKPRERPVARSCMMLTAMTEPACAKWSCRSFSVVVKGRFPTKSLDAIVAFSICVSRLGPGERSCAQVSNRLLLKHQKQFPHHRVFAAERGYLKTALPKGASK